MEQVSHIVLQRSLRLVDRFHPLLGPREAAQEKHDAHHGDDRHSHQPAVLLCHGVGAVPAEGVRHGHKQQEGDETADVGEHHAERRERAALLRVGAHHAQQRCVGHVDARIDHHHQRVGDVGVDQLARLAEGRGIERKYADEPERNGEEEQVGAELAPAARCAVGDDADDGVEHRVPHAGDEEHRAHHGCRKSEYVGIENHQVGSEQLPEH